MHLHPYSTSYISFMHHCTLTTNFRGADLVRKVSLLHKQVFFFFHTTENKIDQKNEKEKNCNITCVSQLLVKPQKQNVKWDWWIRIISSSVVSCEVSINFTWACVSQWKKFFHISDFGLKNQPMTFVDSKNLMSLMGSKMLRLLNFVW